MWSNASTAGGNTKKLESKSEMPLEWKSLMISYSNLSFGNEIDLFEEYWLNFGGSAQIKFVFKKNISATAGRKF